MKSTHSRGVPCSTPRVWSIGTRNTLEEPVVFQAVEQVEHGGTASPAGLLASALRILAGAQMPAGPAPVELVTADGVRYEATEIHRLAAVRPNRRGLELVHSIKATFPGARVQRAMASRPPIEACPECRAAGERCDPGRVLPFPCGDKR